MATRDYTERAGEITPRARTLPDCLAGFGLGHPRLQTWLQTGGSEMGLLGSRTAAMYGWFESTGSEAFAEVLDKVCVG